MKKQYVIAQVEYKIYLDNDNQKEVFKRDGLAALMELKNVEAADFRAIIDEWTGEDDSEKASEESTKPVC